MSDGRLNPEELSRLPDEELMAELTAIAEKWRPYRSLATSYLFSAAFDQAGLRLSRRRVVRVVFLTAIRLLEGELLTTTMEHRGGHNHGNAPSSWLRREKWRAGPVTVVRGWQLRRQLRTQA